MLALSIVIVLVLLLCNWWVVSAARGKLYSSEHDIPYNKVGLLLGTSKLTAGGHANPFYDNRISAAIALIRQGKIKYLVISGDNGRTTYNEPEDMRADLMKAGVDSAVIFLDYAGFRTFDSIKRLKEIFSQDSVTIISQQFHNERALYIAEREHLHAIGFNAKDVSRSAGFKTMLREKLARVKMILDFWLGARPKFLGSKIVIPD